MTTPMTRRTLLRNTTLSGMGLILLKDSRSGAELWGQ